MDDHWDHPQRLIPSYAEWAVPGHVEERLLGHGVSGRVVAAVNEATGQRVAIKYLHARGMTRADLATSGR